jgi:hypothetical protein
MDLQAIDLYEKIASLNPKYVSADLPSGPRRIDAVYFAESDHCLYLIYSNAYVFVSEDGLRTLREIREINCIGKNLIDADKQSIDLMTESMDGTVLFAGRDKRDKRAISTSEVEEAGVIWRKTRGSKSFQRIVATRPAWRTSPCGNMAAGYIGNNRQKMVAFGIYENRDAHFYYSLDDGMTWRKQPMGDYFAEHVHEVCLPRTVCNERKARLWVTGGDDPSGVRSGALCFDKIEEDGSLGEPAWVIHETPGYRLVALTGDGKHVYIGNESLAGGAIKVQDNRESIDLHDFEYVFGKTRHDYFLFRSLLATQDGLLIGGSSSFGYVSDSVRADSGGYLYVSNNEGATFREIPLGARGISSLTYDGTFLWFVAAPSHINNAALSYDRFKVYRLMKPSPYAELTTPYVSKALILDSSRFYQKAGYSAYPHPSLAPGERTIRVDMSGYETVSLVVETLEAGNLMVEALPFYNWEISENPWYDAQPIAFDGPGRKQILLEEAASHNRYFRVRNSGHEPLKIRLLAFIGKK